MKILGIIPARGGSKRVPRKNIRLLGGKPLICWVIEAARQVSQINRLVVSSDDDEVLEIAKSYDEKLPLRRPVEISTDTSLAIEYIKHALGVIETMQKPARSKGEMQKPARSKGEIDVDSVEPTRFDAVVILQPSSPLTLPEDISATIELLKRTNADTAVSVVQLEHAIHPLKLKVMRGDKLLPYFEEERGRMAEHELPKLFVRNCAVYATRRETIERNQIIGTDCRGYIMPRERSVDINDEMDFMFAEFLIQKGK
jgi:CMP-N-acetylneuraminic acid synthetase